MKNILKNKKHKAFTLAELMIIMAILTILLAALSPMLTTRYLGAGIDNVWRFVTLDKNDNAYSDVINKHLPAVSYVGIVPTIEQSVNANMVQLAKLVIRPSDQLPDIQPQMDFRYETDNRGYDTGYLAASLISDGSNFMLSGPYNHFNITTDKNINLERGADKPKRNTAYGINALKNIYFKYDKMHDNTAIGYNSMMFVDGSNTKEHSYNTFIGYANPSDTTNKTTNTAKGNTAIGISSRKGLNDNNNYNTAIGYYALNNEGGMGYSNTAIGDYAANNISSASFGNVAIGYKALGYNNNSTSYNKEYNTAVGAYSLDNLHHNGANYNTAIGYKAGIDVTTGSHKTCVGAYSCQNVKNGPVNNPAYLLTGRDNYPAGTSNPIERVFIGRPPFYADYSGKNTINDKTNTGGGISMLEVHNMNSKNVNFLAADDTKRKLGDSSVIVNANLVVRGQSYFAAPVPKGMYAFKVGENPKNANGAYGVNPTEHSENPALIGFKWIRVKGSSHTRSFAGDNGTLKTDRMFGRTRGAHRRHAKYGGKKSCICAPNETSYDWASRVAPMAINGGGQWRYAEGRDIFPGNGQYGSANSLTNIKNTGGYCDRSLNESTSLCKAMVYMGGTAHEDDDEGAERNSLNEAHNRIKGNKTITDDSGISTVDYNRYFGYPLNNNGDLIDRGDVDGVQIDLGVWRDNPNSLNYGKPHKNTPSCCPNIISDARLKDIGAPFTEGLNKLKQLKIYNFSFKNDPNRYSFVGVIAQDLKHIFPNAVYEDESGYYKIRWDEMFYAAINAVKEINSKVEELTARVAKDFDRVEALKKDNADLNKKLDKLAAELAELEKSKK